MKLEDHCNEKNSLKKNKVKSLPQILNKYYHENENIYEIGVDEVGRGPLFGRVYTAAVILPKESDFNFSLIKDSKKFHSKKKINEVANYIKDYAIAWHVSFVDENIIDNINILQATQLSMHNSIKHIYEKIKKEQNNISKKENEDYTFHLLIDGNYFNPYTYLDEKTQKIKNILHTTIEGGDNKYASIAAASILAKVERDKYIEELCNENPELISHYGIDSNKGYGAKKHMEGIKEHGITIWHRKTFGICKKYYI